MNTHRTALSTRLIAVVAMAFMLFPLLTVIPVSFTAKRYLSMPDGNWSLRHYEALLSNPDFRYYQVRNEQGAVHAATAYAKVKNRLQGIKTIDR